MLYLKVRKKDGEKIRGELLKREILENEYRILKNEEFLYFPLKKRIKLPETWIVERKGEKVKKRHSVEELLKGNLSCEELKLLPKSFEIIGDILILELDERLLKKRKEIGNAFLKSHKNVKVILRKLSERKGEFRTRNFEILAGEKRTETLHKEYGCVFKLDVRKVYFSPREATERQRIAKKVKDGEEILVMFSGIAPFAIQIAKRRNCKIICVEKNPVAVKYAEENLRLNKVSEKVKNLCGDIKEFSNKLPKFDRILMPLPKGAYNFLDIAISLLKDGGILHFYYWSREENLFSEAENLVKKVAKNFGRKVEILEKKKVLPYSPRTWKVVLDCKIL